MTNTQKIFFLTTIIIALLSGFWFGGLFIDQKKPDIAPLKHVMVLEAPRKLAIPALQKANGGHFDMASLEGRWSLLFFGYTNCPDVCPASLNTLAQAKQAYVKQGAKHSDTNIDAPFPQVVFISIDPQRDNAELLDEYVRYFDKDFIGATGEEKLLRAIAVQTYTNFQVQPSEKENEYQVGHSLNLVLINPDAELVAVLSPPHAVKDILEVLQQFQM